MKTKLLLFIMTFTLIVSCSNDKDEVTDPQNFMIEIPGQIDDTGLGNDDDLYNDDLIAGQFYDSGEVIVVQDGENLIITYTTDGAWQIDATHLYIGALEDLPLNGAGNPKIGNFPYQDTYPAGTTLVIYTVPAPAEGECTVIAAHAEVTNNDSGLNETAWAAGFGISGNESSWAMGFEVCL